MAVLLISTLVVLAGVELIAIVAARTVLKESRATTRLSYYTEQEWGQRYWAEYNASQAEQYVPYVVWSGKPFLGKTINHDDQGRRVTPGASCEPGAYRLFAFGGSTMHGTGAPDWETIGRVGSCFSDRGPIAVQAAAREDVGEPRRAFTHRSSRQVVPPTASEEQTEPRRSPNPPTRAQLYQEPA